MHKIAKILAMVLGVVSVILWVLIVRSEDNLGTIDIMLRLGEYMTYIAAAATVIFAIKNIASSPEKLKKTVLLLVGFLVVFAIGYVSASGQASEGVTEKTSKMVGAGLYTFYFLTAIAAGAMLVSGIKKMISK